MTCHIVKCKLFLTTQHSRDHLENLGDTGGTDLRDPSTTSSNCQIVCFLYILKVATVMEMADLVTENLTLSTMLFFLELKMFWYSRDALWLFVFLQINISAPRT